MDMRIVNDEGNELPWDGKAAGELQVRGPHVLKSYFRVCAAHVQILAMNSVVVPVFYTSCCTCVYGDTVLRSYSKVC